MSETTYLQARKRRRYAVLDGFGHTYHVGIWRNGTQHRVGSYWLARREARLLRKNGENARVVRLATCAEGGR